MNHDRFSGGRALLAVLPVFTVLVGLLLALHRPTLGQPPRPKPAVTVPQKRDFSAGRRTTLRGQLVITQTTTQKSADTNGSTEFSITVPIDLNRAYGMSQTQRTPEALKASLGELWAISTADPKVEPISQPATAEYQSVSRRTDGSSSTLTLNKASQVLGIGALQITEPGADVLEARISAVIQGDGMSVQRDTEGKEVRQELPTIPVSLDSMLKFYFSKKALNTGWEAGKPFVVSAGASREYDLGDSHYTVEAKVQIKVGTLQEEYELEVTPQEGFRSWLPQAGENEKKVGNRVSFRVLLRATDGRASTYYPKKVTVTLEGTSKEPGICLNRPLEDGLGTGKDTPDFRLSPAATQAPPVKVAEDGQTLIFEEDACREQRSFVFYADSYDFGGYTLVKVVAELPNDKKVVGYLAGEKSITAIPVPYRKNPETSHIGDAYWTEKKCEPKADNWDAAHQEGNMHDGDGLSAYEKYRGVWAKSKHQRLNPKVKVLVVENQIGERVAGAFDLFKKASGKASGIEVVELAKGELPSSRVVNVNAQTAHGGKQHGLILTFGSVPAEAVARTEYFSGSLKELPKSPKECSHVYVKEASFNQVNRTDRTQVANTNGDIAHELAHACHVAHHGPGGDITRDATKPLHLDKSGPTAGAVVYGENDIEASSRPLDLVGNFGLPGNDASGDVHCIMCYNSVYAYAMPSGASAMIYCNLGNRNFPGTTFCTSSSGTEWNSKNHRVIPDNTGVPLAKRRPPIKMPLFGDATDGNCMSQFQIKDY